jgi:hypothetical protein
MSGGSWPRAAGPRPTADAQAEGTGRSTSTLSPVLAQTMLTARQMTVSSASWPLRHFGVAALRWPRSEAELRRCPFTADLPVVRYKDTEPSYAYGTPGS